MDIFVILGILIAIGTVIFVWDRFFKKPDIRINEAIVFFVLIENSHHHLGLLLKVLNLDNKSHLISKVELKRKYIDLAARGSSNILNLYNYNIDNQEVSNGFIKANQDEYVKISLPIKLDITINNPPPPEIIFYEEFCLTIDKKKILTSPQYIANYERVITVQEWDSILRADYKIDLNSCSRKIVPTEIDFNAKTNIYLVYNPDPSSKLQIYGYDQTLEVRNAHGVMFFVAGKGIPPLKNGWKILGKNYQEVWSNPHSLETYNRVFPPDENGVLRPIGAFAGREAEMGLTSAAPITRGRTIIGYSLEDYII